jgi:hypothetical protein
LMDIPRVKSNIQKMLDQGAPEGDINAYLATEGVSLHDLKAPPEKKGFAERVFENPPMPSLIGIGKGIYQAGRGLVTAPGEAYRGELDPSSEEATKKMTEGAALVSPLGVAGRAGSRAIPGVANTLKRETPAVPTATELQAVGKGQYQAASALDVQYSPQAVANMADIAKAEIEKRWVPEVAETTHKLLDRLRNVPEGAQYSTFDNLDTAWRGFRDIASDPLKFSKQDRAAAVAAMRHIEKFIDEPPAQGILAGPSAQAGKLNKTARENMHAGFRSNEITGELDKAYTGILERAELRQGSSHSGRSLDNPIRNRVEKVLTSPKEIQGYNDAEIASMKAIVDGSRLKNRARDVGNALGGGGGLGLLVSGIGAGAAGGAAGGVAAGGPLGGFLGGAAGAMIGPAIGMTARNMANRISKKELQALDEQLRKRSPLFREREANAPFGTTHQGSRAALIRALLSSGLQD